MKRVEAEIYVIGNAKLQAYKIGYSTKPEVRLKTLRKHSPIPLELFSRTPVNNAELAEQALHKAFTKHRMHGEWFNLSYTLRNLAPSLIPSKFKKSLKSTTPADTLAECEQRDLNKFLQSQFG